MALSMNGLGVVIIPGDLPSKASDYPLPRPALIPIRPEMSGAVSTVRWPERVRLDGTHCTRKRQLP